MSPDTILLLFVLAVCLLGFRVSSLNEAIDTHQRGRYNAATHIVDHGIDEDWADNFARHDNWLNKHAHSRWIVLTDREKYGENIAELSPTEEMAAAVVVHFQMRELLTKKYDNA